ncbi:MAG: Tellurite resistance protein TerB [Rhodospirillales bacterium]|nr:Tellurite resistance protein TerB [Rhodospirillales bacterium]
MAQSDAIDDPVRERLDAERFVEALAAGAAIVARADGRVDRLERRELLVDLDLHPELRKVPRMRVLERFDHYVQRLTDDPDFALREALDAVAQFADDPRRQRLMDEFMNVATIDEIASEREEEALDELRAVLHLVA